MVNEARDRRLLHEGGDAYCLLKQHVLLEYSNFLKTLPPILLALSPTVTKFLCENQALADALALGDNQSLRGRFFEAIGSLRPGLERRKQERARHLRSLLPKTDVFEGATDDEAIALATSLYECSDCRLSASGLHMLAHDCNRAQKPDTFHPQLNEQGRETVKMLLQVLGLGRETTTLELDRRDDRFACMGCSRGSFLQDGKEVLGRCVRDWRSCVRLFRSFGQVERDVDVCIRLQVAHVTGSRSERWHKSTPKWQLVETSETAGSSWGLPSTAHAYGCMHCPVRIDLSRGAVQWYTKVSAVKEHVHKE